MVTPARARGQTLTSSRWSLILATRRGSSARMPMAVVHPSVNPRNFLAYLRMARTFISLVQNRAKVFGRNFRRSIRASKTCPDRSAVSGVTRATRGLSLRHSIQWTGTDQRSMTVWTNSYVAGCSRPVLANTGMMSSGRVPP